MNVKEYTKKYGREPTAKLRVKCPMCGLNVKSSRFDLHGPIRIKTWLRCYMGRGSIEFLRARLSPEMAVELRAKLIIKCRAILASLDYLEPRPDMELGVSKTFIGSPGLSLDVSPEIDMGVNYGGKEVR